MSVSAGWRWPILRDWNLWKTGSLVLGLWLDVNWGFSQSCRLKHLWRASPYSCLASLQHSDLVLTISNSRDRKWNLLVSYSWAQKPAQHPLCRILLVKQLLCPESGRGDIELSSQCQEYQRIWDYVLKLQNLLKVQILGFYPRPIESIFLTLETENLVLINTPNFSS